MRDIISRGKKGTGERMLLVKKGVEEGGVKRARTSYVSSKKFQKGTGNDRRGGEWVGGGNAIYVRALGRRRQSAAEGNPLKNKGGKKGRTKW